MKNRDWPSKTLWPTSTRLNFSFPHPVEPYED
jgi:hypothetical protein